MLGGGGVALLILSFFLKYPMKLNYQMGTVKCGFFTKICFSMISTVLNNVFLLNLMNGTIVAKCRVDMILVNLT